MPKIWQFVKENAACAVWGSVLSGACVLAGVMALYLSVQGPIA